jgi:hypothetical protein
MESSAAPGVASPPVAPAAHTAVASSDAVAGQRRVQADMSACYTVLHFEHDLIQC